MPYLPYVSGAVCAVVSTIIGLLPVEAQPQLYVSFGFFLGCGWAMHGLKAWFAGVVQGDVVGALLSSMADMLPAESSSLVIDPYAFRLLVTASFYAYMGAVPFLGRG